MPVRSLHSSVMKWPDRAAVARCVRARAAVEGSRRPEVRRIGYFGSLGRGDWGVGSDVDLLIIVDRAAEPFERRAIDWDTGGLPVPADVLVYTLSEWEQMHPGSRFRRTLDEELHWVYERG